MTTYSCPKGHESSEADYCSECGAKMTGSATAAAPLAPAGGAAICPDCGTPRDVETVVFCEICGYNFVTGAHGDLSAVPLPATPVVASVAAEPLPAPADAVPDGWVATLSVDATLREAESPEAPADTGPFTFPLGVGPSLIGRRSQARAVFPEIPVTYDDAVSHRHALLTVDDAGVLLLRDIGSSNGTKLNGAEIVAMVDYPLTDGDVVTFGHWSKLMVARG